MKIRHYLLLTAAALLLAGSFFLPNAVAAVTDSRRLDNYVMIDSQSVSFETTPELDLPDRISLVARPNTETLPLKTGQAMDAEQARETAIYELEKLLRGSPLTFALEGKAIDECSAAFVINSEDPSINMIVWELELSDRSGNTMTVAIDDETGVVLKIIFGWGDESPGGYTGSKAGMSFGQSDEEYYETALRMAKMMAEYYGLPVSLADYQFSGSLSYYRADLFGGGKVISMFGVVRSNGLTMNEKLMY